MKNKIILGLIFITIGVFLLLANLGIINYNAFYSIFDLWPLLLIVIGINVIFRDNKIISYITWLLFFIILIVYGLYTQKATESQDLFTDHVIEKHEETKYANLDLDLAASRLNINSTDSDLLTADLRGRRLNLRQEYSNGYEKVDISFESRAYNMFNLQTNDATYDFNLNNELIWDIDLDLGALSGEINLEDIPVRSIDLDSGAASLSIILGDKHDLDFAIDSGASSLDIIIPTGVGLKIDMDSGLTSSNIEELALTDMGDYYISSDYDSADVKINMDIDTGVGKVNFNYR